MILTGIYQLTVRALRSDDFTNKTGSGAWCLTHLSAKAGAIYIQYNTMRTELN